MRKLTSVALALAFAGLSFADPPQSNGPWGQNPAFSQRHQRHIEWCKQNWDKCKERKLKWLSAKQECLQKSQSYDAFRSCMAQVREQLKEMKKEEMKK